MDCWIDLVITNSGVNMTDARPWVFPKNDPEAIARAYCEDDPTLDYAEALAHARTIIAECERTRGRFNPLK